MVLPALSLALTLFGEYTLVVRSSMLETLGEDYVLTARAKGLPQRRIVVGHALRNAMLPIVTLIALSLGYIVAGAILIETVFSWPGIGRAVYSAVLDRDYPMLQGAFLILTRLGRVLQLRRRPPLLQARPEDHGMKTVEPALAEGTALEARALGRAATSVIQVVEGRPVRARWPGHRGVLRLRGDLRRRCSRPTTATQQSGPVYAPPSTQHWLGTDDSGVDVLSELMVGGRTSMIVGLRGRLVAMMVGGGIGLVAGYFGGWTDVALMRITDYFLVIPDLVLMIVDRTVFGPSLPARDPRDRAPAVDHDRAHRPGAGEEHP